MKYFLAFACLLTALLANSQIVNIPDANFKASLIEAGVDVNNDGQIQNSEAEAETSLRLLVGGTGNTDFTGIKAFINLQELDLGQILSATLDVSGLTNLQTLDLTFGTFSSVNVTGCIGLKNLYASGSFTTLDVSTCINLERLRIYANSDLTMLTIGNIEKLIHLELDAMNVTGSLDLTRCDSLSFLDIGDIRHLQTLNISGLKKIESINRGALGWTIDNLIARNCTGLKTINSGNVSRGVTNFLDVTGCINLETITLQEINVPVVDLSTCINLRSFSAYVCFENFQSLNIKNGSFTTFTTQSLNNPLNICADEFEVASLRNQLPLGAFSNSVIINSYCSFFPGGDYNIIQGKTKLDLNNNGCDNNDAGMPNVAIKIIDTSGNSLIRYTAPSGDYAHYPYKGIFTLTPYFPYPYFVVNPASATITFDTANSLGSTVNFCIQPNGVHNDLEITFLPSWPAARPGFDAGYTLVYKNRGTTTLSGNVQVNFDNSKMNFVTASTAVISQSIGQLIWNYNSLKPFESRTIDVTFNLLPPPVNNINDTITYLAAITPLANDETAFDNSFILPQRVRGSFDPNEKQCIEGSKLDISKIGDYLHYQIHFQNEGTDTAFNVVVTDTLSSKLDWNSFELINSSHPVTISQKNGKLEFIFENIKLPYKAINEPASNGYVTFKIKPKSSVVVGDSLNNTAAIYFDFNMPVITNRATTIVTNTSIPVPVKVEYFSINGRNNINTLNWKAACTNGPAKFSIERSDDGIRFSSIGLITATSVRCQLPFNFSDNDPVAGKNYYRLKITDADGISFYSKILVVGNNKAGVEITAVANNIIYFNSNKQQTITMKIIAADGKEVLNRKQILTAGSNNISLQIKNAAKGIYTLIVYTEKGETITKRFIK